MFLGFAYFGTARKLIRLLSGCDLNMKKWDQYQYLGNCPPTPPLTQQQSINNNLG